MLKRQKADFGNKFLGTNFPSKSVLVTAFKIHGLFLVLSAIQ